MTGSSRAPFYDLFKLIVAVILLLLFLFLLFWMRPSQARQADDLFIITFTASPATHSPTVVPVSPTSPPLTETPAPTATPLPTTTPEPAATQTPTAVPLPTETPLPETTPIPITEVPEEIDVCEASSRTQLKVGTQATIVRTLNFRSSPGISTNWILTNAPGTQVEIIGGPECTRYAGGGSYLWWQIKLPNGQIGWSAEASAYGVFYFMEPTP